MVFLIHKLCTIFVCIFIIIAEYRSIFLRHLKDMLHLSASTAQHNDLQQSRISRDESDLKSLIALIEESWINPFQGDASELICLSTGKLATSDIENDLLEAQAIGENAFKKFSKERIESNPPVINFHDTLKKFNKN